MLGVNWDLAKTRGKFQCWETIKNSQPKVPVLGINWVPKSQSWEKETLKMGKCKNSQSKNTVLGINLETKETNNWDTKETNNWDLSGNFS